MKTLTVRFSGPQGSGVQLATRLASELFFSRNYRIFAINDFESRIKGGYSFGQLSVSTQEINSVNEHPDIIFSFSEEHLKNDQLSATDKTIIFVKGSKTDDKNLYYSNIRKELERSMNIFCLGILSKLVNIPITTLKQLVSNKFSSSKESLDINLEACSEGYDFASKLDVEVFSLEKALYSPKLTLSTGAKSIAAGAVAAGVKFYAGYPMSPSTGILMAMAGYSMEYGIFVEQAEDEISAANMVIGASYAGVRAMTATSGGGFSLMAEAVSLSAMSENPLVVIDAQRPGPATGFPTRTAQGDLKMVLTAGHGEFSRVVLAPGNHEKAFLAVQRAHYLAEKYQIPVFILVDQNFIDSIQTSGDFNIKERYQERFIKKESVFQEPAQYERYKFSNDPVSERAIPGLTNDLVFSDSNMHDEFGKITEDKIIGRKLIEKLFKKKEFILKEIDSPEVSFGKNSKIAVVGWGSTWGVIRDACLKLKSEGVKVAHIHFHEIYPLDKEHLKGLFSAFDKTILIENSVSSQLEWMLSAEYGISFSDRILKYDGRPFYLEEVIDGIRRLAYDRQ